MRWVVLCHLVLLAQVGCAFRGGEPTLGRVHAEAPQLITVVTEGWDDYHATLRRYERRGAGRWTEVGSPIAAVIGRAGFGWGRGLHGVGRPGGRAGPVKQEGDDRSPAGVFTLGTAYGYAPGLEGGRLPYVMAGPDLRCVDDPASSHYNQIVAATGVNPDWTSAERMRRHDALYELAIVVGHNTRKRQPGAGSCIFLHVWAGRDTPVSGCTAMAREDLWRLSRWLRPGAVLVALPREEYAALRESWGLP